ncbi:MAG TPA: ABC transporter ATP-binding protein [Dehalococcoidia bacterium]|jgi:tungstate transport system ATP-binding protein|nr:ABC transporter ATP-binding protein [Dehalococcoidia bacterium]
MSLIEVVDLHQKYGERDILKNINIRVDRGEAFAVIGPTGAGKTTLLRLIDLLGLPTSGRIYFDGIDVTELRRMKLEVRRRMAFVLQKPVVFNTSVYNNIAYGLKWRGVRESSIRKKVSNILEMVDLLAYRKSNARTLSGGEVQRVAIARAIVNEPEVLLLDEPTANLDPISTSKIEELVANIIHRYDTTIIMATHDMSQGQRLADRIGVLINGEILQTGVPRDVFSSPLNREVAEFVGVENIIDGVIVSSQDKVVTIDIGSGVIEAISDYAVGEEVCACVRPEDIILALSRVSSSARNSFFGEITQVVSLGPLSRIEINCGFRLVALVTKRSAEELNLTRTKKVCATFKATGVHIVRRGR